MEANEQDPKKEKAKAASITGETLYQKLARIMGQVSRVPKRGYNQHFKYQFTTESDLSDHIRPMLAEAGIGLSFAVTDVIDLEKDQVQVRCEITLSDGVTEITRSVYGRAQDKGDKGIYKAMTGAVKYWLFKNFLVSTGDDPENEVAGDPAEKEQEGQRPADNPEAKKRADYNQYVADAQEMRKLVTVDALDKFFKDREAAIKASFYYTNYLNLYKELKVFITPKDQKKAA